jgi:hypothetical protein
MLPRQASALQQQTNGTAPTQVQPRRRQRKGPKRLNKRQARQPRTAEDLDKEMEDYRAQANGAFAT